MPDEMEYVSGVAPSIFHGATARVPGFVARWAYRLTFNLLGPIDEPCGSAATDIGGGDPHMVRAAGPNPSCWATEAPGFVHGRARPRIGPKYRGGKKKPLVVSEQRGGTDL